MPLKSPRHDSLLDPSLPFGCQPPCITLFKSLMASAGAPTLDCKWSTASQLPNAHFVVRVRGSKRDVHWQAPCCGRYVVLCYEGVKVQPRDVTLSLTVVSQRQASSSRGCGLPRSREVTCRLSFLLLVQLAQGKRPLSFHLRPDISRGTRHVLTGARLLRNPSRYFYFIITEYHFNLAQTMPAFPGKTTRIGLRIAASLGFGC